MSKVYSIENTQDNRIRECCPFDIQDNDMMYEHSTYNEVLRILREAFKLVDFNNILRK